MAITKTGLVSVFRFACSAVLLAEMATPLWASENGGFDRPIEERHVAQADPPGKSGTGDTLNCSYFDGFMVKAFDTGGAGGDDGVFVVNERSAKARAACGATPIDGELKLNSAFAFVGVRGKFILLQAADANGAVPFAVFDRSAPRARYSDSVDANGAITMADEDGTLHLRYKRAINTNCSILKDAKRCWDKVAHQMHLADAVVAEGPPVDSCVASYNAAKASSDDPSVIAYAVDLTVGKQGSPHVQSRAALTCAPLP